MAKNSKEKLHYNDTFQMSVSYLLSCLCYAYYVKGVNVVSDHTFDELEKLWKRFSGNEEFPKRGKELEEKYSEAEKEVFKQMLRIEELRSLTRIQNEQK